MWSFLKKLGWRIAGIYCWLSFLTWLIGFGTEFKLLEQDLAYKLGNLLSGIGASPVNSKFLPAVIKLGWVLFIAEFKPLLLIGFFFYIIFFPFLSVGYIIVKLFRRNKSSEETETSDKTDASVLSKRNKTRKILPFPLLTSCGFCLLAWFVIFGDAKSWQISSIGVFFAGLLLCGLVSRLFVRIRPITKEKPVIFTWLEFPSKASSDVRKQNSKKIYETLNDVENDLRDLKNHRKMIARLMIYFRSKYIQNVLSLIILFEFITSMIVMATCAILFWALVAKSIYPNDIDILKSLHLAASYFLPALDKPPLSVLIPTWIAIGTSITSWVLFVLYLSPAGNLIPDKQKLYLEQLVKTHQNYRQAIFDIKREIKTLKYLSKSFSENRKLIENSVEQV